jgi:hypothetical protein
MPSRTSDVDGSKPDSGMLAAAFADAEEPADGDALAEPLRAALGVTLELPEAPAEAEDEGEADDDGAAPVAPAWSFQGPQT